MPRRLLLAVPPAVLVLLGVPVAVGLTALARVEQRGRARAAHLSRGEIELRVVNPLGASLTLHRAGSDLDAAVLVAVESHVAAWLPAGRYFLEARRGGRLQLFPLSLAAERAGPDTEGSLALAVRGAPAEGPPPSAEESLGWVHVPGGPFEIGDRRNPGHAHHVWLPGFFIARFETTNGEFRRFVADAHGYDERANWTEAGWAWRARGASLATARLAPDDPRYPRFGRDPLPVVLVTWYEADAYCRWLTRRHGGGRFWFRLATEAEWEKAARGPDGFDYGLGMELSEPQAGLYNWKKNPDADPTLVDPEATRRHFRANRYGIFHASGNAAEWTASVYRHYNRQNPYREDDRNDRTLPGMRVTRGGSWYSANTVRLYLAYREEFQPEMSSDDLGFRVVAVPLPGPLR